MKLELSDGMSNHSDFSNDSQNSQMSTADFMTSMGNGIVLTPTMFMTLEGLNSGVPTRTTPTVTPTTLRNIEQTFFELQKPEPHENEAGFVPPLVHSIGNNQYISASEADNYTNKSSNLWPSSISQSSLSDCDTRSTPPLSLKTGFAPQTRRNMGGRKPVKDVNISPEEEERRQVRRERNKAAAARCRKRRVDLTNTLIGEAEELERKQQRMREEINELRMLQEELQFTLNDHRNSGTCRLNTQSPPDIKPFDSYQARLEPHLDQRVKTELIEPLHTPREDEVFLLPSPKRVMLSSAGPMGKISRPNTLNVGVTENHKNDILDFPGIAISTPSSGMMFNFESLMGGGTGLTPVNNPMVPSCSTQQRNIPVSIADISPDCSNLKLVSL